MLNQVSAAASNIKYSVIEEREKKANNNTFLTEIGVPFRHVKRDWI